MSRSIESDHEDVPINGEIPHATVDFVALPGSPENLEKIDKGFFKKICDLGLPGSPNYGVVVKIAIAAAVATGVGIAAKKGVEHIIHSREKHTPSDD